MGSVTDRHLWRGKPNGSFQSSQLSRSFLFWSIANALYLVVFTQFQTQNRCALLLELL